METPKRIPDLTWDDGTDRATFTNGLRPYEFEEHEGAIGLVQIGSVDEPCAYFDLPLAKCMRRWLDDLIAIAEEAGDASD